MFSTPFRGNLVQSGLSICPTCLEILFLLYVVIRVLAALPLVWPWPFVILVQFYFLLHTHDHAFWHRLHLSCKAVVSCSYIPVVLYFHWFCLHKHYTPQFSFRKLIDKLDKNRRTVKHHLAVCLGMIR